MIEILLLLVACLLGWLFARRQKPTEQPTPPDNRRTPPNPPKYEDKIDEIESRTKNTTPSADSDSDIGRWLDDNVGGKRK